MQRGLILALLACCSAVCSAKKGGSKQPNVDFTDVLNPDPDAKDFQSDEYNTDLTEGDIKGTSASSEDRNAASDTNKLWPQGIVPYIIDKSVKSEMKQKVNDAIADFHKYTCVKLVTRKAEKDYIRIKSDEAGCWANLGRGGGEQKLNLADPGCKTKGTAIHEMLHSIGFFHEHRRSDRDKYINIHWNNIQKKFQYAFDKLDTKKENTQQFPYDFSSVMHYGPYGFSKNRKMVITAKDKKNQSKFGQRGGFSKQDVKEVNKYYKCNGKKSGVGGKNGCMDKDGDYCKKTLAIDMTYCKRYKHIADYCTKSCKLC